MLLVPFKGQTRNLEITEPWEFFTYSGDIPGTAHQIWGHFKFQGQCVYEIRGLSPEIVEVWSPYSLVHYWQFLGN